MVDNYTVRHSVGNVGDNLTSSSLIVDNYTVRHSVGNVGDNLTSSSLIVDNYTVRHSVGNVGDNLTSSSIIWFTTTPSVIVLEMLEIILLRQA